MNTDPTGACVCSLGNIALHAPLLKGLWKISHTEMWREKKKGQYLELGIGLKSVGLAAISILLQTAGRSYTLKSPVTLISVINVVLNWERKHQSVEQVSYYWHGCTRLTTTCHRKGNLSLHAFFCVNSLVVPLEFSQLPSHLQQSQAASLLAGAFQEQEESHGWKGGTDFPQGIISVWVRIFSRKNYYALAWIMEVILLNRQHILFSNCIKHTANWADTQHWSQNNSVKFRNRYAVTPHIPFKLNRIHLQ